MPYDEANLLAIISRIPCSPAICIIALTITKKYSLQTACIHEFQMQMSLSTALLHQSGAELQTVKAQLKNLCSTANAGKVHRSPIA